MIAHSLASRSTLLISCATLALASAAVSSQSAEAQQLGAFQGTINSSIGSVTRTPTSNTTETITIGSNTATINWTPTDQQQGGGPIEFLPNGNVATFTSLPGVADYTVLNRIIPVDPTRAISLDGHVISTLQGTSAIGGNVWFYSPGGIVVGASAVFDVGGLLLTSDDVPSFTTNSNGFSASFSGPAGSTSMVQVQNGAQINALQSGSYVALVAPRVEQDGNVRLNGSAAYAAGEQLTMTMNQGLFDIQVDVGTSDPNGIVHNGSTTGPANSTAADNHSIYMVAVPKNQALTMLLGGSVGFDATTASVQNGQIILSAGYNVSGTSFDNDWQGGAIAGTPAGISIAGGHYTSSVNGRATGDIEANGGGGTLTFDGDLTLQGLGSTRLVAYDGETVSVNGNARISSDDLRFFDTTDGTLGLDAQGGAAEIRAESGGTLNITGSATVTADASPATNSQTLSGGTSRGGVALIDSTGGDIVIGGATRISATGFGDTISHTGIDGRDSWGGDASLIASGGGSIRLGSTLDLIADGDGSYSALTAGGAGGTGTGGYANIAVDSGGAIGVHGTTTLSATGVGGQLISSPDGNGGEGDGGTVSLSASNSGSINLAGDATLLASGFGSVSPATAGVGHGGTAELSLSGGGISSTGTLALSADGTGGAGSTGGQGSGGFVNLFALGNGNNFTTSATTLSAQGVGGRGTSGAGGEGDGGSVSVYVSAFVPAAAAPSEAALGSDLSLGAISVNVRGDGGIGSSRASGGSGFGGSADLSMDSGSLSADQLTMTAGASGGAGGDGGSASGGSLNLLLTGGSANIAGSSELLADAQGGKASTGSGGDAEGGSISLQSANGATFHGGDLLAVADAVGGSGPVAGSGHAGAIELLSDSYGSGLPTSLSLGDVQLRSDGSSGVGSSSESTPTGDGGDINVLANGATLTMASLTALAKATDLGGNIALAANGTSDGQSGSMSIDSTYLFANSSQSAGSVSIQTDIGSSISLGSAQIGASGANGGSIQLTAGQCECGEAPLGSAGEAQLQSGGGISAGDLTLASSGDVGLSTARSSNIAISGNLNATSGGSVALDALGASIDTHDATLNAADISTSGVVNADTATFNSTGNMSLGALNAKDTASFNAGGLADFEGTISSPTITVTSHSLNIGKGGSLGADGVTDLVTLNALSDGPPVLIGQSSETSAANVATSNEWQLADPTLIHSNSVVINAKSSGEGPAPDVEFLNSTINGSSTSGGGIGSFTINTDGSIHIDGNIKFQNVGAADILALNGGHLIELNTDKGSLTMFDPAGKLGGTLKLSADNVWVGDSALLNQLESNPNFASRDTALKTNNGPNKPEGFVQAGTVKATILDTFFVQNSGTDRLFAGISVDDGGLTVTAKGPKAATVVAYGREVKSNGTILNNSDFFNSVVFVPPTGFTSDSTLNGCTIGAVCETNSIEFEWSSILVPVTAADVKGDGSDEENSNGLINVAPLFTDDSIDEPVTSGGDVVIGNPEHGPK